MAAPSSSSTQGPSSDALASIITQVSPNGQPARAPANANRPARPVKKKVKTPKKATSEQVPATTSPELDTLPPAVPLPTSTSSLDTKTDVLATSPSEPASTSVSQPASKPEASTSTTPAPSQQQGQRTKKKKSPWSSLLSAFGCSSSSQAKNYQDTSRSAPSTNASTTEMKQTERIPVSHASVVAVDPALEESSTTSGPSAEMVANNSRLGAQLSKEETGDVMSGAVVPPGAEGTPNTTPRKKSRSKLSDSGDEELSEDEEDEEEEEEYLDEQDEEDRIIQNGGMGIPIGEDGIPRPLLSVLSPHDKGRKCLVLDLDETLVHSSFKMIHSADYIVPVEIENQNHNVYVIKRPGVDQFLKRMGEIYEVVVFTASLSKYADPVLDQLDIHRVVRHRLFRESCYNHRGNYVKDLSQLGRPIGETIIIDNSPASYIFHPKNAVPVSSWFNDPHDTELTDMIGVLADLADVDDVRSVLDGMLEQ